MPMFIVSTWQLDATHGAHKTRGKGSDKVTKIHQLFTKTKHLPQAMAICLLVKTNRFFGFFFKNTRLQSKTLDFWGFKTLR